MHPRKFILPYTVKRPTPTPTPRPSLINHHQSRTLSLSETTPFYKNSSSQLPPRPTLPSTDLKHSYLKGSGPGGQKINKTASAVQITHLPTGLVVKSQATRSRSQNHTIARRILAEKVEFLEKGGESRVARKVELARKRKRSSGKKARRKYRALEGGNIKESEEVELEGEEGELGGEGLEGKTDMPASGTKDPKQP